MEASETSVVLPPGVDDPRRGSGESARVVIDNRTGLPDPVVEGAVEDYWVEHASLAWGGQTTFQTYVNEGSLLARSRYTTPANVIDEIRLARELAERDDDVGAVIGELVALAFGDGMENQHRDESTVGLFNAIARNADLDMAFAEMYRELLISSQINSALLFTRERLTYTTPSTHREQTESVAAPLVGVLPAEDIRVLGNDLFRTGTLAYLPCEDALRRWLDEYFDPRTTPARKAEMGRQDRIAANLFIDYVESSELSYDTYAPTIFSGRLYILNPRMVQRTTFPKGQWRYPRPLLTRNFALLEAKRLLNILDFALLQGGSNYVVVAKKGSDQRPAQPTEVENLKQVVTRASRSGVIVGDHRLSFEIITPKLDELLNSQKRKLIGRKLAMAMLRQSERETEQGASQAASTDSELLSRIASYDRRLIRRHVESHVYAEVVKRNPSLFTQGSPSIWFPKIILQGTQFFTDYIIKLRDRGDIPRAWAVEAAGFDFDAAVQQRERELRAGVDETMVPGAVPHSSPEMGPQDNSPGRPRGAGDGRPTNDGVRPRPVIQRNQGETIRAWFEEEVSQMVRMGEQTFALLEEHADRTIGRVTRVEREMVDAETAEQRGSTLYVPVNRGYECEDFKAVRLRDGLGAVVGVRKRDGALVTKVLSFREPEFDLAEAAALCEHWGFPTTFEEASVTIVEPGYDAGGAVSALASAIASQQPPSVHIDLGGQGQRTRKVIVRDPNTNQIIGVEEVPVE